MHLPKMRGLLRKARAESLREVGLLSKLDAEDWFNHSHVHLDWLGRGNVSWAARLYFLLGYARVFRHQAQQLLAWGKPFQLWIILNKKDAGQDAVFIHSLNPNPGAIFPLQTHEVIWGGDVRIGIFDGVLPEFHLREGRSENALWFYAVGVGVSLEQSLEK